jgi:hypothetical protein
MKKSIAENMSAFMVISYWVLEAPKNMKTMRLFYIPAMNCWIMKLFNIIIKNINGKILKKIIFQIGLLTHHLNI